MEVLEKKMTWEEFRQMEVDETDHFIYELINGILMRRTSPSLIHQEVSRKIERKLDEYLLQHPIGRYFHAPADVYLDEITGVVPDISFISKERYFILDNEDYIAGAPDLIVEIISPGNVRRDRVVKKQLYEQFAVKEYWLIDPNNKSVEVFVMQENAYVLTAFLEVEGKLTSTLLPGLEIEISQLFA